MPTCSMCNQELPESAYYRYGNGSLRKHCKRCNQRYQAPRGKAYYQAHKARILAYQKQRRERKLAGSPIEVWPKNQACCTCGRWITGQKSIRCQPCRLAHRRAMNREYQNSEKGRIINNSWKSRHPDLVNRYKTKSCLRNLERNKEYARVYSKKKHPTAFVLLNAVTRLKTALNQTQQCLQ